MEERPLRSSLYVLEPLVRRLPEVEVPKRYIGFNEKMLWSGLALVVFLIMSQIPVYGMIGKPANWLGALQYVLASKRGTIMQLGIGPIVTAGIVMQLLVGARLLNLDLSHPRDRALFTGVQKILAILVGFFQASAFVVGGFFGSLGAIGLEMAAFMIFQLLLGVLVVLYLDELVSKYGFGSGIGLFIAGGVSMAVFWQAFGFNPFGWVPFGAIPKFVAGAGGVFFGQRPNMMGVIATMAIFLIVIYLESVRVEIPLAYSRYGGIRGRYPIRFIYASVIPVILSMVMFTNVRILAGITGLSFLGTFDGGSPTGGLYYYLSSPQSMGSVAADPVRAAAYMGILVFSCMGFAWLWVQMTNMGPRDVAKQLKRSGMSIPGFRRDMRIMEKMLTRYIAPVTLLGGALIGILAAGANFLGALSSGTGILLTVSIIYRLYREIARERVSEMFPAARKLLGE